MSYSIIKSIAVSIILIIKIHEVEELKKKLGTARAFADAVGIHNQNVQRYSNGYVVIERKGKFKLDKVEFWR